MKTAEPPHNPENLDLTPGYRFIGRGEAARPTDEVNTSCPDSPIWFSLASRGVSLDAPVLGGWTIRRALNVDNPYAPPPAEWGRFDYLIFPGDNTTAPEIDAHIECWGEDGWSRISPHQGVFRGSYYRRPITTAQSRPCGEVFLGATQKCCLGKTPGWVSKAEYPPAEAEIRAGIWVSNDGRVTLVDCPSQFAAFPGRAFWQPARPPAPPKPTLPAAPLIDGSDGVAHTMRYHKGEDVVIFGCARISVNLLECAKAIANKAQPGNRRLDGITLDSRVQINAFEIAEILAYVDAVNKP